MAAIKLNATEKAALDSFATDSDNASLSGIVDQLAAPYASSLFPVVNYATIKAGKETTLSDAIKGGYAPYHRYVGPISAITQQLSYNISFTSATDILTLSLSDQYEVARTCLVSVVWSAFVTNTNTLVAYWIEVNGSPENSLKFWFNTASQHGQMYGNWLITLPQNQAITIKLRAQRSSGSGTISLDANDIASISLIG